MKNSCLTLVISLLCCLLSQAQTTKELTGVVAGTLSFQLNATEFSTITSLTIKGSLNAADFFVLRDEMPNLTLLNIGETTIEAYEEIFEDGSYSGIIYPANEIPPNAFYDTYRNKGNSSLISIILPRTIEQIGAFAFQYCSRLQSVEIPQGVQSIKWGAFQFCRDLTSITLPESLTEIGIAAFAGCSKLRYVSLPPALSTLDTAAFADCSSLTAIEIDENNSYFKSRDGVLFGKNENVLIQYPAGKKEAQYTIPGTVVEIAGKAFAGSQHLEEIMIPSSVKYIANYSFADCFSLKYIEIPESVVFIGIGAFFNCKSMTKAYIPESIDNISSSLFSFCKNLTEINIPTSVNRIEGMAFYGCSNIPKIDIPKSVHFIGNWAFSYCDAVTELNVDTTNNNYISLNGVLFDIEISRLVQYPSGKPSEKYKVPASVRTIESQAFSGAIYLKSVILPDSLTSINSSAFSNCTNLSSIIFPNSLRTIGSSAFSNCTSLVKVELPPMLQTISHSLFSQCKNLKEVSFSDSIKTIESLAFFGCEKLKEVSIPAKTQKIEPFAFANCLSLHSIKVDKKNEVFTSEAGVLFDKTRKELLQYPTGKRANIYTIPSGIEVIGVGAFSENSYLQTIIMPNSVTTIKNNAFKNTAITWITIPASVEYIGNAAFYKCNKLRWINVKIPQPLAIYEDVFGEVEKSQCVLFVPSASAIFYQQADVWNQFMNVEEE